MIYFLKSWNSVKLLATSCCYHMSPLNQSHFTLKYVVSTEKYTSGSYRMMELAFPRQNFYNASTSGVLSALKDVSPIPSGKGNSQSIAWPYCTFSLDSCIYSQFPALVFSSCKLYSFTYLLNVHGFCLYSTSFIENWFHQEERWSLIQEKW